MIQHTFLVALACAYAQAAGAGVTETDYLADMPTVISVSRIAQTLEDTPGAVTILDRAFIRMTGARNVVDVLRFVPGFQTTTSVETDASSATYHGRNDDWANRIQVLVDGRSVYTALTQGSSGLGWQTLALDDIERIEVLRGSNSATYGARAFLGVVNIISRDVRDTLGAAATITRGDNGISDAGLRLGWAAGDASYRLSADRVGDNGLQGAFGKNHSQRLNFTSHFALEQGAELDLRAGGVGIYAGRGDPADTQGNPARPWSMNSQYVQMDWHQTLDESRDLSFSASHIENSLRDRFIYTGSLPGFYLTPVEANGDEYSDTLTAQYSLRVSPALRTAWGAEFRRERDVSINFFDELGGISSDFYRLFGSAEWRLSDRLLLNAGAMAEHSTIAGGSMSPRLMLNWHLAPGHTLRAGASTAFRPPSAFEKYSRIRIYNLTRTGPPYESTFNDGSLQPERLTSRELGYFFAPASSTLSGDVRFFQEHISDGISPSDAAPLRRYLNNQEQRIHGVELQLTWAPAPATKVFLAQAWTQIDLLNPSEPNTEFRAEHGAARYAASITLMHRFSQGLNLSLMHQLSDDMALMSDSGRKLLFSMQRTDLRLAQEFRLGASKAEAALTVQNLGEPYADGNLNFFFHQQAMFSLKFEL